MKQHLKTFCGFLLWLLMLGCTNDDMGNSDGENQISFSDVTVIAQDNFQTYQIDVLNQGEDITTKNLSNTLGFDGFDLLYLNPPLISFFQITANNFNVFQIHLETSQPFVQRGLCDYPIEEFRRGPYVSSDEIGFITTQDNIDNPMNYLNTFSKETISCTKSEIGNGDIVGSRYVDGKDLYLTIVVNDEDYILRRINLDQPNIIEDLVLNDVFKATVQENIIHVFYPDDRYETYEKESFELIDSKSFDYNLLSVNLGLFNSEIKDNILYFDFPYQQPSLIADGPATIDLNNSVYINGQDEFALRIRQKLNNLLEANLELTDFAFDIENNTIIYGYDIGPNGGEGGIVYTNFDAEILSTVELPYVPSIIIVR